MTAGLTLVFQELGMYLCKREDQRPQILRPFIVEIIVDTKPKSLERGNLKASELQDFNLKISNPICLQCLVMIHHSLEVNNSNLKLY